MFRRIVLLLLSIIISACGGEESYPEYPKDRQQGILSGVVFDAAVSNATVRVYEFNQGKVGRLLATTNTNPDGRFSVALTAGSTPLYIESSGGGFLDPYSNNVVTANDRGPIKLRTYINFIEGQSRKVMLTPLTNIAVGLADYNMIRLGQQTAAAIESANAAVNSQYGFDVIATEPLDISKGNWSAIATQGHQYGAFLLAYASLAYESLQNSGGSDSEKVIYTSYNLADLQFRDIQATGQLDGWSMDEVSALPVALSYGLQKINADFYTNSMAQHLLRVVNNPEVNASGTPPGDYSALVNKLNNASGGIYATRTPEIIDDEPPVVARIGEDVLSGSGLVTVKVTDFIGIDSVDVFIQTRPEGGSWGESESCMGSNSVLCRVQSENIKSGVREAQVVTKVNTLAIDQLSTEAIQARLVFGVADVLENANNTNYVPLQWDNIAPTINITSPGAFNPVNQQIYILSGTIEDASSDIASVSIGVNAGVPESIACTMQLDEATQEEVCVFSKTYDKTLFIGGQTNFFISASDVSGNTKEVQHVVLSDTTAPTQAISFPQVAMKFFDADAGEYQDNLTQEYFQDLYGKQYLNLNYAYALQGLKGVHPDVDFSDFTSLILDQNQIPYLVLTVSDSTGGSELTRTSAEDLVVTVTYEAGNIGEQATIIHKQVNLGDKIPHEILPDPDADGYINQVRYFIPFVKEIFGSDFTRVNEQHAQTVTIVTKDGSGNTSVPYKFQFKSTFNLPTIKVTAPYINASANVERLLGSGKWGLVGSCALLAESSNSSSEKLKDAASCTLNSQFAGEIHRVTLTGPAALFYNWSKEERQTVTLTEENGLRAYAVVGGGNGNRELVVTELSVFQSGFFDYLFEQSDKSQATAQSLLSQVDAMFGEQTTQFFGFNPVSTRYATADELVQIPNPPSNPYLYRFLLEAMVKMSESVPIKNSIDLAKSFYSDISSNGKPDGLNAAGESVDFGGLPLSERFYREELGKQFYEVTAGDKSIYSIDSKVAMYYANRFAKSDPKLQGQSVFSTTPDPVDQEPPTVTVDPLATNLVEANNRVYISGDLSAIANVSDPSGLDKSTFPTKLELLWGDDDSVDATNSTGVTSILIDNDPYQEKHQFGVNTLNNFPGIARLDLLLSSSDREGNSYGYNSMLPFSKIYYVDNEPPSYSFTPPFRADAFPDDTYINTNYKQLLKFTIDERVGEDPTRRRFIFRNGSQERVVNSDEMVTEGNVVKIFLCRAEKCNGDTTPTVDLGPGKWVLLTEGGDSLGNTITATDPNVGRYQVNIDYEEPAILPTEVSLLGGNEQWAPISVINNGVGNVSPLGDIQLQLHTGAGLVELEPCIQGQDCSALPAYTLGDKGNTKVQLVADNLIHGKTYTLYISASDTAFQPNKGEGKFEFKVDKMGPSITTPTLADGTAPELSGNIMGTRFKVSIASITDDSGVEDVSVWQELANKNVQLVEAFKPEGLNNIDINLQPANTDLIQTDEGKQIKIFVKATDSHGFEGRSNAVSTLFDNEGPTISLINYSPDDFYVPGFIFNVAVRDVGINPIAPGAVSYWTYTGSSPAPGDEGKQPTNETQIETNMQQDFTLKIRAEDIRGNTEEKPFAIKVDKTAPEASLTARYQANDLEISPNENITKNGTVDLYLDAFDPESQIDSNIEASLIRDGNTEGETIVFSPVEGNDRLWKSQLNTQIANDGQYNLIVTVYNRAKANKPEERKKNRLVRSLKVQREGYSLSITEPADFGTHIFGRSFRAEFGVQNAPGAILNKLECWLREDYNSDEAPDNDTSGLYKVYTNTATPVCQFDNVDSNLLINPVLITRTTASNEAQVDQIFSFNMLDVDAPVIANKDAFILKQGDVDTVDGVKKLTIRVTVDDVLSGMDSTATVKLLKGLTEYEPTSIQPSNGNQTITYTFTGNYEDLIRRGQIEHFVKLTGLKDRAGNIVVDTDANIQLRVPNVKPDIEITGVKNGDFINGQEVTFFLKKSVGEDARQENIFVDLGDSTFDFLTNRVNFPSQSICVDDPAFECIKFEGNISPDHANSTIKIKARIVDIWGNEAETYLELGIDNKPPKISDIYSISSNTSNQVLVNFDISDEDSGLKAVKYTVKDIGNSSFIVDKFAEDETIAQLEFDTSKLGNEKSFRVEIKATDNVDQVQTKDFTVDITKPTVTLELPSVEKEQSNLILENLNQTFNIITSAVPETRAEVMRYVFTLVALDPGLDNISVEGNFAGIDSATGSLNLNESLQGRYDLKLSVFDNLGRDISSFTLKDETVPTTQKPVLVDLANPVIANVQSQQQPIPPVDNKFVVHVFADISDHHLIDSTVTASLNQGGSTIAPVKIVRPDAPSNTYMFEFLVEAGSYELTLNAADAAGHSQSLVVPAVTVDPWQVPTVTVSTQDGVTDLGSGQDTTLVFEFSEPVTGFAAEDIVLTTGGGGDAGTLSGLTEQSPGRWTAVYRAPVGVDTGITLSVTADSYVSAATQLSGSAASLSLDVIGSPLTASVSLPEGDEVSRIGTIAVTFTFNRPVSGEVVPLPEEGVWSNLRKNPAMT
ncbi:Ig-like domain-containing protein, partial [Photobacterium halotolerans]|uniref:Ig-like domain-containing protein n=1 Tax=Photobacterium halotolerans TaxID=265726 RepID=UPI00138AB919